LKEFLRTSLRTHTCSSAFDPTIFVVSVQGNKRGNSKLW